jgi:hypothetical protein
MTPSYDDLYAFLSRHYKHERFAGRDGGRWGDYSAIVTRNRLTDVTRRGYDLISRHESRTGEAIIYNERLELLDRIPR